MQESISIGIIGGSGVYKFDEMTVLEERIVETPYGNPSDKIIIGEVDGVKACFLPRHGSAHSILPHEVNYRANIYAMKSLGVKYIVSISAVGSLKEELPPETIVLPDQFIDWTKGQRERSFYGNGIVAHVSCADPINKSLQSLIQKSCEQTGVKHSVGGTYVCIEGPQFSSRAESTVYRSFGASVIGMTNVPESYLAKEANIAYATTALVTDYDCWKEEHCTVEEIMKVMQANNVSARKILKDLIPRINKESFEFDNGIEGSIMTPIDNLNKNQQEIVKVLVK